MAEFESVFEEDVSTIKGRMVEALPDDYRKEEGDAIVDAVAPSAPEVLQLQINQDYILANSFAIYGEGEWLDLKLEEVGLKRASYTFNQRNLSIDADAGVVIPKDYVASAVIVDTDGNPLEYTVDADVTYEDAGPLTVAITCTTAGTAGNLATGSEFVLIPPIPGVRSITDLGTTVAGTEQESDASALERYLFKQQNPDTGGNKNDYVRWAKEVPGVGKAACIPRWNGNNTVKVVIVGTDYHPAIAGVVDDVQDYLDPGAQGLGEGKAPCGAATTVVAATGLAVNITATVTWEPGADEVARQADFEAAVAEYLKTLVLPVANTAVVYNKIGSILISTADVSNYSALTINGGTADLPVTTVTAPTLGSVTL